MIRKAVIVVLTAGTLASCLAWGISYPGYSGGYCVHTKPGIDPIPVRSIVGYAVTLHNGVIHIEKSRLPANPISSELSRKMLEVFEPGWGFGVVEAEFDAAVGILYTPSAWRPAIHRPAAGIFVTVPLWITTLALGAWPAIVVWRGPLSRMRRRRAGLCVECAYDLTGNESGVCPECGTVIDEPRNGDRSVARGVNRG